MKTIWKYETSIVDKFTIEMPYGAEILSVMAPAYKFKTPVIYAIVDVKEKVLEERFFEIFGTGQPMSVDMGVERKYIGTYQLLEGGFVGHLFERIN